LRHGAERHREAAVMSRARRLVAVRCEQRPTDQTGIAMTTKTMNDLLMTTMQDVYYAERQILKALPKLAKASENEELKNALMHHREETEGQVERLQKAFDALANAPSKTCEAINGLIEEGDEVVEEFEQGQCATPGSSPARRPSSITKWRATAPPPPGQRPSRP